MRELKFFVDESKCIRCGACVRDCVVKIIAFDAETEYPRIVPGGEERCIGCQHCLAVCPTGAVEIFGRDPEESMPGGFQLDAGDLLKLIANRRSFRSYRRENLDPVVLDKLKDMLRFVPTGVNADSLFYSFVEDVAVMDRYRDEVRKRITAQLANPGSQFLMGMERYRRMFEEGHDVIFRGAPHMVVVSVQEKAPCAPVDPVIALSYFELYAQALGVGTVWCGLAYSTFREFPDLLEGMGIPEGYRLAYVMLFGPSDLQYPRAVQPEPARMATVR